MAGYLQPASTVREHFIFWRFLLYFFFFTFLVAKSNQFLEFITHSGAIKSRAIFLRAFSRGERWVFFLKNKRLGDGGNCKRYTSLFTELGGHWICARHYSFVCTPIVLPHKANRIWENICRSSNQCANKQAHMLNLTLASVIQDWINNKELI